MFSLLKPKKLLYGGVLWLLVLLVFSCSQIIPDPNPDRDDNSGYYAPGQYQQQPPYYQKQQYPAPQQYQDRYRQQGYYGQDGGYYPYPQGGSRVYSNPYDIPPAQGYNYYDSDQYYVPQRNYQNVEQQRYNPVSSPSSRY